MPGGDGTGPMGMGPMTGRATGYCEGNPVPESAATPGGGRRGFGGGRGGGGRRRRNRFRAAGLTGPQEAPADKPTSGNSQDAAAPEPTPDPKSDTWKQQSLDLLNSEAQRYANGLEQIKKRIAELEAELHEQ